MAVKRFPDEGNPHGIELTIPDGVRISSDFGSIYTHKGELRSRYGIPREHRGVDIAGRSFGDPLIAPFDGEIRFAGPDGKCGGSVRMRSKFRYDYCQLIGSTAESCPYFEQLTAVFCHVDNYDFIDKFEPFDRGAVFGTMGRQYAGRIPHAHMVIQSGFTILNPHKVWLNGVGIVTCFDENKEYADQANITSPVDCKHRSLRELWMLAYGEELPTEERTVTRKSRQDK